jgi:internalin A
VTDRELLDLIARARDEEWEELNLSYKRISVIPESIEQLIGLQTLDIYNNKITVIPNSIGQLTNLRIIDLRNNEIEVIPNSIRELEKTTELKVFFTDNSIDI